MALSVLQPAVGPNPSAAYYSGKCATCQTVVTGRITSGEWTFYQALPTAQLAPAAAVPPILWPADHTGHIVDWLFADCPTSGCPATIWTTTKSPSATAPVANPVSNSPAPVQPLT